MLFRKFLFVAVACALLGECGPLSWRAALAADTAQSAAQPVVEQSEPPLRLQPPGATEAPAPAQGGARDAQQAGAASGQTGAGSEEAAPYRPFADVPTDDAGYVKADKIDFYVGQPAPGLQMPEDNGTLSAGVLSNGTLRNESMEQSALAQGIITLESACRLAIANHPTIDSASADYDEARADYGIARSVYFPRMDWSTKWGPSTEIDTKQTEYGDSALLVTQKVYQFGALRDSVDSARLRYEGAEMQYQRTCENIASLAINAYLAVLQSEELVRVYEGALGFYRKLLTSFRERYMAGISSRADAQKVEVSLRDAEASLVRQNEQLNTSHNLLENIIGHSVSDVVPNVDLLRVVISDDLEATYQKALAANAQLLAAKRQIEAQAKSVSASQADKYPSIGYRLQVKNEFQKMRHFDEFTQTVETQLTMDWTLFDGYATTNTVLKRKAALRRLKASVRGIELEIRNTLTDALNSYRASAEEHRLAKEAFDSSVSLMGLYLSEFDLGIRTLLDLTTAREGQTSAAIREINARFARIRAAVNILLEEGRLGKTLNISLTPRSN